MGTIMGFFLKSARRTSYRSPIAYIVVHSSTLELCTA